MQDEGEEKATARAGVGAGPTVNDDPMPQAQNTLFMYVRTYLRPGAHSHGANFHTHVRELVSCCMPNLTYRHFRA